MIINENRYSPNFQLLLIITDFIDYRLSLIDITGIREGRNENEQEEVSGETSVRLRFLPRASLGKV